MRQRSKLHGPNIVCHPWTIVVYNVEPRLPVYIVYRLEAALESCLGEAMYQKDKIYTIYYSFRSSELSGG